MDRYAQWTLAMLMATTFLGCTGQGGDDDDTASSSSGSSSSGGSSSSSGSGGSSSSNASTVPSIRSAAAQASGRTGTDLLLRVEGADPDGNATYLVVRFLDALGGPVAAVDVNRDGTLDSEGRVVPAEDLHGKMTFTATYVFAGALGASSAVKKVALLVEDAAAQRSTETTVDVAAQPVRSLGQPCDPTYVQDRCQEGLGCGGSPTLCQEGQAPQVTQLAYLHAAGGPRILVEGTEPDDDLAALHVEFLDAQGQPVLVDLDGDDAADSSAFDYDAVGMASSGAFFVGIQAGDGFDSQVAQVAVTPADGAGHQGVRKTATVANTPVRSAGQTCDLRGFNTCGSSLVCASTGAAGATTCQNTQTARTAECSAATVVDPTLAPVSVTGRAEGGSLWDAPVNCVSNDPVGRPEGSVKLHLPAGATTLTLTTDNPGTTFDTSLYVLPGCGTGAEPALGCNDDVQAGVPASTLVLTHVPPGDYLVVVDSFSSQGGSFELSVTVE